MESFNIGRLRVHRIEEWQGRFAPPEAMFQGFDEATFARYVPLLEPGHVRDGQVYGFLQSWLIEAEGRTILYDTGAGNAKERPRIPIFHRLDGDFLANLSAAGFAPDDIDTVICSHLHIDHVGWNTMLRDGAWVPTFRNAQYVFPAIERVFWDPANAEGYGKARGKPGNANVFEDSVQPILDAGLALLVGEGYVVAPGLTLHAAPGHTPGHLVLRAESGGERALFVADILHHLVQIFVPEWNSMFCEDFDQARRTRFGILAEAADTGACLIPAHFAGSHHVWVKRESGGFRPLYARPIEAAKSRS